MQLFSGIRTLFRGLRRLAWRAWRTGLALTMLLVLVTAFVRDLYYFPRSVSWEQTSAEVIESSFVQEDDGFSVDFKYRYMVDGITYEGERITFFQYAVFANAYQNQRFIGQHRAGTTIDVYYDPREPGRAVVMRTIPLSDLWSPLLLVVCLVTVFASAAVGVLLRHLLRLLRGADAGSPYEGWMQQS